MRRVVGYLEGRAIWSENTPANPGSMPIRGSLVVAESGMTKQARHRDRKRLGGKPLEGTAANPQNQGVESTTLEVRTVSLLR